MPGVKTLGVGHVFLSTTHLVPSGHRKLAHFFRFAFTNTLEYPSGNEARLRRPILYGACVSLPNSKGGYEPAGVLRGHLPHLVDRAANVAVNGTSVLSWLRSNNEPEGLVDGRCCNALALGPQEISPHFVAVRHRGHEDVRNHTLVLQTERQC